MKAIKLLAIALVAYLAIAVAFETLVSVMGSRQARNGVGPDEDWLVLTTTAADGSRHDTVVAGFEHEGRLYVAANHWPRSWYERAVAHPEVEVVRAGAKAPYLAVALAGAERDRIAAAYTLPWPIRLLTGFPPRAFLRLDPRP
jgi:hypothetical protein